MLKQNGSLKANESLVSKNGKFTAVMQLDGNFVVYMGSKALWASNTSGSGANVAILQGDQNFVLYAGSTAPWATATNSKGTGEVFVLMQDDGNLVMYDSQNKAIWATNTTQTEEKKHSDTLKENEQLKANESIVSANGVYTAIMQGDGNFVIYKQGGGPIWASNTSGSGALVILQGDHNLVVYQGSSPKWASDTGGKGSGTVRLLMQNDANLVIYDGWNQPIWASNTAGK